MRAKKATKKTNRSGTNAVRAPKEVRTATKRPRKRPPKDPQGAPLIPKSDELIVRMYRQGLGDCFLLALPSGSAKPKYVLIDCGVHSRQTDGPARLRQVMNSLVASVGSHIDVVVATHEHADHLSGFVQKDSPFLKDDVTIGKLWLGWTEKRGDRQADMLRKKRGTAQRVIDKAVEEAGKRLGVEGKQIADHLLDITDFVRPATDSVDMDAVEKKIASLLGDGSRVAAMEEPSMDEPGIGVAKRKADKEKPSSNELALGLLAAMAGENNVEYCEPGNVLKVDGVSRLRAYVLAPPRSELLQREGPSKIRGAKEDEPGGAYKEVYLTSAFANRAFELSPRLDVEAAALGGVLPDDWRYPFATAFRRVCDFGGAAGEGDDKCWSGDELPSEATRSFIRQTYLAPQASWRRIDGDWFGAAETLALNLVGDTNNTSVVLAFEWGEPGSGLVLLFPADAQVGNWLSWRDQNYGKDKLKVDDLLSRVLLYKVGHHGSHNATVRRDPRDQSSPDPHGAPFGLELMNDIIAMIPVDGDAARKKMPDPWKMPHEPLYRRLREKARRRILRSDLELAPLDPAHDDADRIPGATSWKTVPGLTQVRWRKSAEAFSTGTAGPLFYDVAIKVPE